ncbi:MAG: glycosyltransferase [Patescibacteria group bacterium]|nr:glycosyltransferase [Patescibacteria group bacterium]
MAKKRHKLLNINQELSQIRRQIDRLNLPQLSFLAVNLIGSKAEFWQTGGGSLPFSVRFNGREGCGKKIVSYLRTRARKKNLKFVAAQIFGGENNPDLSSTLWLKGDIIPYVSKNSTEKGRKFFRRAAADLEARFDEAGVPKVRLGPNNEVEVGSTADLSAYQKITPANRFLKLKELAEKFGSSRLTFINATPRGGGVAIMRRSLTPLLKSLGIKARWFVLINRPEAFAITKTKFHNILQNVAGPKIRLTASDRKLYLSWMDENAQKLKEVFKNSDVVVIDDPQPAGLIPHLLKINPHVKIIYRSHIQIESILTDRPGTPQKATWDFLYQFIRLADCFVSHPVKSFIPSSVPLEKTVLMPAVIDPLNGLNKNLAPEDEDYYLKVFNKLLLENNQEPLDLARPYLIQIARFDPSKGIPDVIESFQRVCERLTERHQGVPQLIICGNDSVDDTDGVPELVLTWDLLRRPRYRHLLPNVRVAKLPHLDQLLNVLLRKAKICLQLSHKEGLEYKVTEALAKGVPVVAYKTGGIPLQITDKVSGFLAETGNTEAVAGYLYDLLTNETLYQKMSNNAAKFVNPEITLTENAINYLYLATELLAKGKIEGRGLAVSRLVGP